MLLSALPAKFQKPFATNAGAGFIRPIPSASQILIQAGAASLTDGFPPVTFDPVGAGGTPPFGQDMNGLLNQSTAWDQWFSAGGPVPFDATFSSQIGGYPQGAILSALLSGYFWFNTTDGNTSNPETGGSGWILFSPFAITTGAWQWRPTQEVLPGWAKANATTIGSAASGASQVASSEAFNLYSWSWTNFSNTQCPVSGGRGANPAADFAANKTLQMLDMRGCGIMGMDTMGGSPTTYLNGVPVTTGAPTTAGSILGENLHALIIAELAAHAHLYSDSGHVHNYTALLSLSGAGGTGGGGNAFPNGPQTVSTSSSGVGITIANTGSSTGHNTVDRSYVGTHYFKL